METWNMFAAAIKLYPDIKWGYRRCSDLISQQHPILIDGLWYPGRLAACFDIDGQIVRIETYCFDASRPFSTKEACQQSIDGMPF